MPSKKRTNNVMPDKNHYVSVSGQCLSTTAGTIHDPWSLDYAVSGADGRIGPGDTVWVRGGTYRSEQDFEITVSGTATDKITFKAHPDETVILDGALAEFATRANTAWVEDVTFSPSRNVYRSGENKYPAPGFTFYGGFLQIDGEWYSLAPHKSTEYLVSNVHEWDAPNPRYLGPGIAQKDGYLYIRLDNSTVQAQLGRPVPHIDDPDPRHHEIYLCRSNRFGLKIPGSHLVIEGFQINHFGGCFLMDEKGQTDITIRNCGGRPIYFGARSGQVGGLTFDSCKFYAHMPGDRWWVAYGDIKEGDVPADHVRKFGLGLGYSHHVEVVNCLFDEFFDGILAPAAKAKEGHILGLPAHNVQIHDTTFNHIWDDAWQMVAGLYQIDFHHNFCYGAGPSVYGVGTDLPTKEPGTVYIHHNVVDTTKRLVFWRRYGATDPGMRESIPFSSHRGIQPEKIKYTWPRKLYYNTIVTGQTPGGSDAGWSFFCAKAPNSPAKHEVYNNIFHVIDGRPGGREFDATSQREIYDGNVYWYETGSPWRLLDTVDERGHKRTFNLAGKTVTVADLHDLLSLVNWSAYYPPGWEHAGLTENPQLDSSYRPQNRLCQKGAINLTNSHWPCTERYERWRGAIKP